MTELNIDDCINETCKSVIYPLFEAPQLVTLRKTKLF